MNNFLPLPAKLAEPLPDLGDKIRLYIQEHFHDTHPDAFKHDIAQLASLRKQFIEGSKGPEVHREVITGLSKYYAQVTFLSTKFPPDIGLEFTYHLPYPAPYTFNSDPTISLASITYERAATLYNMASVYASLGAAENRAEIEGIKRALAYMQNAAGVFSYIRNELLPTLEREQSSFGGIAKSTTAGQDMTTSFLGALEKFCLAEAQECFWQRAVLEKYKNGLIAKLAVQVSEYYDAALTAAAEGPTPTAHYFPATWTSHVTVKRYHFDAAAQYRLSMDDLEKGRYGEEIARLQQAESLAKKALEAVKPGLGGAVTSDLKSLQAILASSLKRAIRDNDLVYIQAIPPASQLSRITSASMVKAVVPPSVDNSLDWLLHEGGGPLFSGLVPYGVHLALSIYDDKKDTLVRTELHDKREELDALAATTLQSLGLPGSITALDRPTGLPPALLQKAEEIQAQGGVAKVQALLQEVSRVARANNDTLEEVFDILDQEATEEEMLHERHADIEHLRPPSHEANRHLVDQAGKYRATLIQAKKSDGDVLTKWQEWVNLIGVLAGGEAGLERYIPSSGRGNPEADITPTIRTLRSLLEDLDDARNHRARLVAEAQRVAQQDDIRSLVVQEAARLAHGGTGDVQTEWFEDIFEKELAKYHRLIEEMHAQQAKQERILANIKTKNETFIHEKQEDTRVKHREKKLQEMEMAYWKWREIVGNCEEGIRFYNGFSELLTKFKETVQGWVYGRRSELSSILAHLQARSEAAKQAQRSSLTPPVQPEPELEQQRHYAEEEQSYHFQPAPKILSAPTFTLPPPDSSAWQSAEDFLPPPPTHKPSQHVPAGEPPTHDFSNITLEPHPASSPRRSTRNARQPDQASNPFQAGASRRKGGGVV
ncbi:hypothetical protein NliqN6_1751 [Naganishia liquefaciens]|uniref:BRO1 domain-containing protein n=1 Tax=Naganishia liquefaciens TaxID=104408 RepID=A0A8H3TQZ1_9TREE|nr:hypothetical protein NliqN6_1751 [Naganishia liquefaciens]